MSGGQKKQGSQTKQGTQRLCCCWTLEQLAADKEKRLLLKKWDPPLYVLYKKLKKP